MTKRCTRNGSSCGCAIYKTTKLSRTDFTDVIIWASGRHIDLCTPRTKFENPRTDVPGPILVRRERYGHAPRDKDLQGEESKCTWFTLLFVCICSLERETSCRGVFLTYTPSRARLMKTRTDRIFISMRSTELRPAPPSVRHAVSTAVVRSAALLFKYTDLSSVVPRLKNNTVSLSNFFLPKTAKEWAQNVQTADLHKHVRCLVRRKYRPALIFFDDSEETEEKRVEQDRGPLEREGEKLSDLDPAQAWRKQGEREALTNTNRTKEERRREGGQTLKT